MNHQCQLEKKKYRNWVRGGLAYKYLKEGIEGFADEVVQQEHTRILIAVNHTPGNTCNQCCLRNLKPIHKSERDPVTGGNKCYWGQSNCNCLYPKKRPCHLKVCDRILEDILKCHGSTPPTPNWKNSDVQKWCTDPWEIAKCFINAPGYSDKTKAADIDTPGLLHVFINNINLQLHFSDSIDASDTLRKILQRRNELFHSPAMEMEDTKLDECIDEIIEILDDEKELKTRHDAEEAVYKLKQLKHESFIITTHDETEVCRDALASITKTSDELKQTIQDAKDEIFKKQKEATDAIEEATVYLDKKENEVAAAVQNAKTDIGEKQKEAIDAVEEAKADIVEKQREAIGAIEEAKAEIGEKQNETTAAITGITQKALQDALQELDKHSVHKRAERLESDSSIAKQRLTSLERKIDKMDIIRHNHQKQLDYVQRKQVLQKQLVTMYQNHYVRTSISPLKSQDDNLDIKEIYVAPKMLAEDIDKRESQSTEMSTNKPIYGAIQQYREILQTNGRKNKNIYIVGDVGTGKSTFCKMMIQNWCSAVTEGSSIPANDNDESKDPRRAVGSRKFDPFSDVNDGNINEMRKFDFLFFVPLQRMSGLDDITEMIKAIVTAAGLTSTDLIDRIFEQESERCLIVSDGLDEWTPPKVASVLQHVSFGLPNRDGTKQATLITLSRLSAKGILNMKSSEYDQKVHLVGIDVTSMTYFIEKYLSKFSNNADLSYPAFMKKLEMVKLKHLEKTPLLLQQLVWLYGSGYEIGNSVTDIYCHLVNIMLGWYLNKEDGEDMDENQTGITQQTDTDMRLPRQLQKFPRYEANKQFLFPLARVAFEALTSETRSCTFGRSHLRQRGVSKEGITTLIKLGILVENNCFNPTQENTQLEFIHIAYVEFFAALYVSSHYNENQSSKLPITVLQDLFQKCKSVADVLQFSNVLKMICGLSPFLVSKLSSLVSDTVSGDESLIRYRNSLYGFKYPEYSIVSLHVQLLILDYISEGDSDDQPMFSLYDVIIDFGTEMSFLQRIIPDNVLSLDARYISNEEVCRWISCLKRLQYMRIGHNVLSCGGIELVTSLIQQAPLKHFTLDIRCDASHCRGHNIDLSKNDQLQKLDLKWCNRGIIHININTKHLEILRINVCNIPDIDLQLNASNLTELHIGKCSCNSHIFNEQVDYLVHTLQKLRKLRLEGVGIADSALTVTPGMRNLKHIELESVNMTLRTWCRFYSSLLTLQQSVQVDTTNFSSDELRYDIRWNTSLFVVIEDNLYEFHFRTKK